MSTQPSMAHLEIPEAVPEGFDILRAQRVLQERVASAGKSRNPTPQLRDHTEVELLDRMRMNIEADLAENQEILDRLPWKDWKQEHIDRREANMPLEDEERLEIMFEMVDKLHFLMNEMIGAGFKNWDQVVRFYIAKNQENLDRVARGY